MNFSRLLLSVWLIPSALFAQTVLVKPYVQPGNGTVLEGADVKVIAWLTDQTPGNFTVEYAVEGGALKTAAPERVALDFQVEKSAAVQAPPAPTAAATASGSSIPVTLEEVTKDIIKALALGAKSVLVGRATLYGIATAGQEGGEKALQMLGTEFEKNMGYVGARRVSELGPHIFAPSTLRALGMSDAK
jgi:hypothetical protein